MIRILKKPEPMTPPADRVWFYADETDALLKTKDELGVVRILQSLVELSGTVPATSTLDLDSMPLSSFKSCKYFIEIENSTLSTAVSFDLSGFVKGANIYDSVYNKIGDQIAYTVNFVQQGPDAVLRFQNLGPSPILVKAVRINLN